MKSVVHAGAHLANPIAVDDGVVFEQASAEGLTPILLHATSSGVREVARFSFSRPRGVLHTIEDDRMICVEPDGTLSAIAIRDGRREVLRFLAPMPAAVAITPEQVVWANSETRFLDGGGVREAIGQVWRWWRGTEDVECLGEHPSFRPDVAVAATTAIAPGAMTSPVYLAADYQLGVIDVDGLHWIAREPQPISALACSPDAVLYISSSQVVRRDQTTGATSVIYRAQIPLQLAVHGRRVAVTRNGAYDRGRIVEPSHVAAIDLDTGEATILADDIGRPAGVAACELGVYVIAGSIDYGGTSELVFVPWGRSRIAGETPARNA